MDRIGRHAHLGRTHTGAASAKDAGPAFGGPGLTFQSSSSRGCGPACGAGRRSLPGDACWKRPAWSAGAPVPSRPPTGRRADPSLTELPFKKRKYGDRLLPGSCTRGGLTEPAAGTLAFRCACRHRRPLRGGRDVPQGVQPRGVNCPAGLLEGRDANGPAGRRPCCDAQAMQNVTGQDTLRPLADPPSLISSHPYAWSPVHGVPHSRSALKTESLSNSWPRSRLFRRAVELVMRSG